MKKQVRAPRTLATIVVAICTFSGPAVAWFKTTEEHLQPSTDLLMEGRYAEVEFSNLPTRVRKHKSKGDVIANYVDLSFGRTIELLQALDELQEEIDRIGEIEEHSIGDLRGVGHGSPYSDARRRWRRFVHDPNYFSAKFTRWINEKKTVLDRYGELFNRLQAQERSRARGAVAQEAAERKHRWERKERERREAAEAQKQKQEASARKQKGSAYLKAFNADLKKLGVGDYAEPIVPFVLRTQKLGNAGDFVGRVVGCLPTSVATLTSLMRWTSSKDNRTTWTCTRPAS